MTYLKLFLIQVRIYRNAIVGIISKKYFSQHETNIAQLSCLSIFHSQIWTGIIMDTHGKIVNDIRPAYGVN